MEIRTSKAKQHWLLLFLIYMPTTTFLANTLVGKVLNYIGWVIVLFVGIRWIISGFSVSNCIRLIGIYSIMLVISTFINDIDCMLTIVFQTRIFFICILLERLLKRYPYMVFNTAKNVLFWLTAANLLTMIFLPNGISQQMWTANEWTTYGIPVYIFGKKNNMIIWLLTGNFLAQLNIYNNKINHRKGKSIDYLLIILTVVTAFVDRSAASIFVICMLTCFIFLEKIINALRKIMNIRIYTIVICIILILLFGGRYLSLFGGITSVLGKDTTFSGRTDIWERGIEFFTSKFLFGYGNLELSEIVNMLGDYAFVNLHNTFLDIAFRGGVLLVIPFIMIIILIGKRLMVYSKNTLMQLSMWALFSLFIEMCVEALNGSMYYWFLLVLLYNVPYLIKDKAERNIIQCLNNSDEVVNSCQKFELHRGRL